MITLWNMLRPNEKPVMHFSGTLHCSHFTMGDTFCLWTLWYHINIILLVNTTELKGFKFFQCFIGAKSIWVKHELKTDCHHNTNVFYNSPLSVSSHPSANLFVSGYHLAGTQSAATKTWGPWNEEHWLKHTKNVSYCI